MLLTIGLAISKVYSQQFPESLFKPPPYPTIPSKVCINMGSKDEKVGPYEPENDSITIPYGVNMRKEIKSMGKKPIIHRRAFQVQVSQPNILLFYAVLEPLYRYNIELGFYDPPSRCRKRDTARNISVGMDTDEKSKFLKKSSDCSKPYFVTFESIFPNQLNRMRVEIETNGEASIATACFEKDSSTLTQFRGTLYVDADDEVEVFLNGKSIIYISSCEELGKSDILLRYGDVIAATATNKALGAALRISFISNGKEIFNTGGRGWKARNSFPETNNSALWKLPEYIDDDWSETVIRTDGCSSEEFPTDTQKIWIDEGRVRETVLFRYRFTG